MDIYYRKSVNLGPFRVNIGKSGLGCSVGGRGFQVGKSSRGRKYCLARSQRVSPVGLLFEQATESGRPAAWFLLQHPRHGSRLSQIWRWLSCSPRRHPCLSRNQPMALPRLNLSHAEMPP
jgi:hypothetical protein